MAKKKRQDNDNFDALNDIEPSVSEEDVSEDEEEREDSDAEDVFAEDESDIAMLRKLEDEDSAKALSAIVLEEEVGFNPMFDWSSLPEAERSRFEALKSLGKEEIAAYQWKRLVPLQKWMVAYNCMRHELHDMFREIALTIIKARKRPEELCIEDIYLELVWDYVSTKQYDEALAMVDQFEKAFPQENVTALRVRGLIQIDMGNVDEGKATLDQLMNMPFNRNIKGFENDRSSRDSDQRDGIFYEIGYSLLNMKRYDLALHYFDRAKNLANMNDNYELTMSIDNARAMTLKCMNNDDII